MPVPSGGMTFQLGSTYQAKYAECVCGVGVEDIGAFLGEHLPSMIRRGCKTGRIFGNDHIRNSEAPET